MINSLSEIKTGDVVLVHTYFCWYKPLTYLSALIRFFDKTFYNHCKLVVKNIGDVMFINEALAGGIENSNAAYNLKGKKILVLRPKQALQDEINFIVKTNSFVGDTSYYFFALVKQLVYLTTGYWIKTKWQKTPKKFYCSEYCAYMHNMKDWWKVAPRDLLQSELFETIYEN